MMQEVLDGVRGTVYSGNMNEKQMYWATIAVMLVVGFLGGYLYRELAPTVGQMIPSSCTHEGKTYKSGASFPAGDGCNSCSCQNGDVACTLMACDPEGTGTGTGVVSPILPGQSDMAKVPDQRLTAVPDPKTPVPVKYVVEHRSALNEKTVSMSGVVVANWLTQEKCTGQRCALTESNMQPAIILADTADPSRNQLYDVRVIVPEGAQIPAGQYPVGVAATVTGRVSGSLEGVTMSYGLAADDPVRY